MWLGSLFFFLSTCMSIIWGRMEAMLPCEPMTGGSRGSTLSLPVGSDTRASTLISGNSRRPLAVKNGGMVFLEERRNWNCKRDRLHRIDFSPISHSRLGGGRFNPRNFSRVLRTDTVNPPLPPVVAVNASVTLKTQVQLGVTRVSCRLRIPQHRKT